MSENPEIAPAPLGIMTYEIGHLAEAIAFWARIFSLTVITGGLAIALLAFLAAGGAAERPEARAAIIGAAGLYLLTAAVTVTIGILLYRYGQRMEVVARGRRVPALIEALQMENVYWRVIAIWMILNIIAAVLNTATPLARIALVKSQGRRTARQIQTIGHALEDYAARHHQYPDVKSFEELVPVLEPKFIDHIPRRDGWEHPFTYTVECKEGLCSEYRLSSTGMDGKLDERFAKVKTDYVFGDGRFVTIPDGEKLPE
jgi:hypothetical protein